MEILLCKIEVQAAITSLEKLNPPANEVFPLMVMSRKHSSLLKKTKRLIGTAMLAMLEING